MEQKDQQQPVNQAGPSSAAPETQPGLQETVQGGDNIIAGARNDDQLQRLNDIAKEPTAQDEHHPKNEDEETGPADRDVSLW
jgi:hypothetical protein